MCSTIFKKEKIISYKEKSFFKLFKKRTQKSQNIWIFLKRKNAFLERKKTSFSKL